MTACYAPGDSLVLVTDHALVATDVDHADGLLTLPDEVTPLEVVDALSGGSLADLPDFACVLYEGDDLRIVARGQFAVTVSADRGHNDVEVNGVGAGTWVEHHLPGGSGRRVVLRNLQAGSARTTTRLPVSGGVVLADELSRSASGVPTVDLTAAQRTASSGTVGKRALRTSCAPSEVTLVEPLVDLPPEVTPDEAAGADSAVEHTILATDGRGRGGRDRTPTLDTPIVESPIGRAPVPETARPIADIVLPDGSRHPVASRVLIGRRPEARHLRSGGVPTLLSVASPYISSTHLEVSVDDNQVRVTDLSTNGTVMIAPGAPARALVKGEPTAVIPGTVLALADDYAVTVELPDGG